MNNRSIVRSRVWLLVVIGCFVVPLIIAVAGFYWFPNLFLSASTVNHAPLVHPAKPLEAFTNLRLNGNQVTLANLQRKWSIVHRLGQSCDQICQTALYNTRQIRLALGKDSKRLQRLLIGSDRSLIEAAAQPHPDMARLLRITGGIDNQLAPIAAQYHLTREHAFLIDPLGNVMMVIPADLAPSKLLQDLKKLLRLSKIG